MYGNVVTNKQLRDLIRNGALSIDPFEPKNLKAAAYTLTPGRILKRGDDGEYDVVYQFGKNRNAFVLEANDYVVIEPKQVVKVGAPGIVGTFITASTNIEKGLLLIAGQIDSNYGMNDESLRFGVRNLLNAPNTIDASTRLVHLQLIDMRGSASEPVQMSKEATDTWNDRRPSESWVERNVPNYSQADE